jgi:hypothetical protein
LKIAYLIFPVVLCATFVRAQEPIMATTEDGRKILVYPDGTWRLSKQPTPEPSTGTYEKSPEAKLFVKASKGSFGVWINPQKWKQEVTLEEDPIKITFTHKGGEAYAMMISERVTVPTDTLKKIVIANAKEEAPDVKVISEEKRIVNGKQVLCMTLVGTVQNVPFTYYGYYYGGPEGTIQVVTYTFSKLFDEFRTDFEEFLNGTQIGETSAG